jgi:hypothetical protein
VRLTAGGQSVVRKTIFRPPAPEKPKGGPMNRAQHGTPDRSPGAPDRSHPILPEQARSRKRRTRESKRTPYMPPALEPIDLLDESVRGFSEPPPPRHRDF